MIKSEQKSFGQNTVSSDIGSQNLTKKSLSGLLWSMFGAGGQAVIQLAVLAVLARLLSPEDFGVVGAATIVMQFSNIFSDLGVGPAIVQRLEIDKLHLRVGFTLSVLFGVSIAVLVWILSPLISNFFHIVQLEVVLLFYSFIFVIKGLSMMSESLLQRQLKFRVLTSIELFSYSFGYGGVGILLATNGYGYWSLVGAHISQAVIKSMIVMIYQRHPMLPSVNLHITKELLYFGSGHAISRIANFFANQGDNLVIGRMLGVQALGGYGRAYQLVVMPANMFGNVFYNVLFPAMSKIQNDQKKLSLAYYRSVSIITLAMIPLSVFIFTLSPEIISLVLGSQWMNLILPFQILSAGLVFRVVHKMSDALARSKGVVFQCAWRQCIYALLVLSGAWGGHSWGISGVAYGVLGAIIIIYLLMTQLCRKLTSLSLKYFIRAHMPGILLGIIIFLELILYCEFVRSLFYPDIIIFLSALLLTALTLVILCYCFPRIFLGEQNLIMIKRVIGNFSNN